MLTICNLQSPLRRVRHATLLHTHTYAIAYAFAHSNKGATSGGKAHTYRSDTDNDKDVGRHSAVYTVTEDGDTGDLLYTKQKVLPDHAQVDRNHSEHIVVQSGQIRSVDVSEPFNITISVDTL